MKRIGFNLTKAVYSLAVIMAAFAVNTTCHYRYYQEKMDDKQLDSLKKYHAE